MQSTLIKPPGFPEWRDSAQNPISKNQKIFFVVLVLGILASSIYFGPLLLLQAASATAIFLIFSYFIYNLIVTLGSTIGHEVPVELITEDMEHPEATPGLITFTRDELSSLTESELSRVSIILPMFHEGDVKRDKWGNIVRDGEEKVVAPLIKALSEIDYPHDRHEFIFALEESDRETIAAVKRQIVAFNIWDISKLMIKPPAEISFPDQNGKMVKQKTEYYPQTKPNACKWALKLATGEICGIYDAEDKPEPDQIKKYIAGFRKSPDDVVCLQAKLEYSNAGSFLTDNFTAEYAKNFDIILPGLSRLGLPIPLGGTSNFFKTSFLREIGDWDPTNVTEDRDLGYWIARRQKKVGIIDSVTWEEACSVRDKWIKQRSRWIKGTMVTYFVHMKNPIRLFHDLGLKQFLSFQMECGVGPLLLLLNPVFWATTIAYIATGSHFIESLFPGPIYYMGLACMTLGTLSFSMFNLVGCLRREAYNAAWWTFYGSLPYAILMSRAAQVAFFQLVFNPHYWELTEHGLDQKGAKKSERVIAVQASGGD